MAADIDPEVPDTAVHGVRGLLYSIRDSVHHQFRNSGRALVDYTDKETSEHAVGYCDLKIEQDMEAPIWVYYQLEGFFQNHRRYVKSYDQTQLTEASSPETQGRNLQACVPAVSATDGRVLYPCGLVATTVFNDTFVLAQRTADGDNWRRLDVNSDAAAITWQGDLNKFHNVDPEGISSRVGGKSQSSQHQVAMNMWILKAFPPVACEQQVFSETEPFVPVEVAVKRVEGPGVRPVEVLDCERYTSGSAACNFTRAGESFDCQSPGYRLVQRRDWGIESGHFIVWMRIAGLPEFRKLWGRVDQPLKAGTQLRTYFVDNYPTDMSRGESPWSSLQARRWAAGATSWAAATSWSGVAASFFRHGSYYSASTARGPSETSASWHRSRGDDHAVMCVRDAAALGCQHGIASALLAKRRTSALSAPSLALRSRLPAADLQAFPPPGAARRLARYAPPCAPYARGWHRFSACVLA
eukprot:CAMPEP_0176025692 /NCGR_PEP_ID=MMETSP0120_2-20121206/12573_1 /TAXON_ID=160619 /ORGANISM="Kryptoperidinium foliaceum, Strain CCMP 1326" /LENGTH=468 /DNA_ID=CAMNT_0017358879 /DNA_START=174 /DNA_END=1580 /DNA_ORIENTATION=-